MQTMVELSQALERREFDRASALQMEIHRDKVDECGVSWEESPPGKSLLGTVCSWKESPTSLLSRRRVVKEAWEAVGANELLALVREMPARC